MLKAVGRPLIMFGIHAIKKSRIILLDQLCNRAYYAKVNSSFYERLSNPLFVIFPQDQTWAMDNLPENANLYFVNEKDKAWTIMVSIFIMALSNSTFYWWGTWLRNPIDNHLVIAPIILLIEIVRTGLFQIKTINDRRKEYIPISIDLRTNL